MKRRSIELSDLPPHVRAQAAAQLGVKSQAAPTNQPTKRGKNKLESAYADYLEALKRSPATGNGVERWHFEPLRLRIGRGAWYKPDFLVVRKGRIGRFIELHETKGFWREAARVRIKVAADLFPEFVFIAVQRKGGVWVEERF